MYLMMPRGRGCWPRPPKQYQLILRAKLRRSQRRHRDLGNLKAICRVERVCGSVGDFLLTVGSRVDAIEADVLPEWSRASEEGVETEMTFGRNELGERPIEIEVRPGVSRRLRRDVRVHLTNQIVDERGVRSSKNEIRGGNKYPSGHCPQNLVRSELHRHKGGILRHHLGNLTVLRKEHSLVQALPLIGFHVRWSDSSRLGSHAKRSVGCSSVNCDVVRGKRRAAEQSTDLILGIDRGILRATKPSLELQRRDQW